MPRYEKPGIYIEAKGASEGSFGPGGVLGYKHLYLVYRRADGTTEVLRGGPGLKLDPDNFLPLITETGKSIGESADRNSEFDRRPSRRLDVEGKDLDEAWSKMRNRVEEIGAKGFPYDPLIPGDETPELTSNSVIRAALEAVGKDPVRSLPDGVEVNDVPGFENNVEGCIQKTREKRPEPVLRAPTNDTDGFGPHAGKGEETKVQSGEVPEAPLGVGLRAEASRNAAEDPETTTSQSAAGNATSDAVPESARAKAMAIVTSGNNSRGLEQGTDQGKDQAVDGAEIDLEDLMLKPVDDLTEDEAKALGQWSWKLKSNDPRRLEIENLRRDFYVLNYGDKPVDNDATGRMIAPEPVRKMPEKPKALAAPNGEPVAAALQRFAARIARPVHDDGETTVVKALQSGLSVLGDELKIDGVAGPKTKAVLKRTVAKRGTCRAEEAFGIGRFKNFAETERNTGGSASGLKRTVEEDVQPLFGAGGPKVAAETLQESLNDLGAKAAREQNKPAPESLKVDGDIGHKTTDAFRSALVENGPEKLTKSYASMLGFID